MKGIYELLLLENDNLDRIFVTLQSWVEYIPYIPWVEYFCGISASALIAWSMEAQILNTLFVQQPKIFQVFCQKHWPPWPGHDLCSAPTFWLKSVLHRLDYISKVNSLNHSYKIGIGQ